METASGCFSDIGLRTSICVPCAVAAGASSFPAHPSHPLCRRPACSLRQNARRGRRRIGRERRICLLTDRDKRSPQPTRRRFVRLCSAFSASSFESELLFVFTAPPPIRDQSEEPTPTSNARLMRSRRRLSRLGPRPLRRLSSRGQQPSRHVDERVERACTPQHRQFARRLDSEPVLTALDNQPKRRADDADVFL
jgi:hypothetical protein